MTIIIDKHSHSTIGEINKTSILTGGSICNTQLIETTDKSYYVYKQLATAPADFFLCEKTGLETLGKTNIFRTPKIYNTSTESILLEYIKPIKADKAQWYQLGEKLAELHQITQTEYGFAENNFLGLIPQQNTWQENWASFYCEQRLRPLIEHPLFTIDDQRRWGKILQLIDTALDNSEPPALIHGDLWNTNIIFTEKDIYLIDPAVYYASREIEIAYLEFVGNFYPPLIEAYQANYPLSRQYAERKNFYLLYPYLVHLHLFGETYLPGLRQILQYYT